MRSTDRIGAVSVALLVAIGPRTARSEDGGHAGGDGRAALLGRLVEMEEELTELRTLLEDPSLVNGAPEETVCSWAKQIHTPRCPAPGGTVWIHNTSDGIAIKGESNEGIGVHATSSHGTALQADGPSILGGNVVVGTPPALSTLTIHGPYSDTVGDAYQLQLGGPRWGLRVGTSDENEDLFLDRNLMGQPATALTIEKYTGHVGIETSHPQGVLDVDSLFVVEPEGPILMPHQPTARAFGVGSPGVFDREGRTPNDYIDTVAFDNTDSLDVSDGPTFSAPVSGAYLVSYRQAFRNGLDVAPIPTFWQYEIFLRITPRGGVPYDDFSYYAGLSNKERTADYINVDFVDIVCLDRGDRIQAMEGFDPETGGTALQKNSAAFSVVFLGSSPCP